MGSIFRNSRISIIQCFFLIIQFHTSIFSLNNNNSINVNPNNILNYINNFNYKYIYLEPGIYDVNVTIENPNLTIRASNPGTAVFSGNTRLVINCDGVILSGLVFQNITWCSSSQQVIMFNYASNCLIENCSFINCGGNDPFSGGPTLLLKYGCRNIRISNNLFENILSMGILVHRASGNIEDKLLNRNIYIEYNYFKNITAGLNTNGGWTGNKAMMIGLAYPEALDDPATNAVVAYNLFENCVGDGEIISNKSNGNIYAIMYPKNRTKK